MPGPNADVDQRVRKRIGRRAAWKATLLFVLATAAIYTALTSPGTSWVLLIPAAIGVVYGIKYMNVARTIEKQPGERPLYADASTQELQEEYEQEIKTEVRRHAEGGALSTTQGEGQLSVTVGEGALSKTDD